MEKKLLSEKNQVYKEGNMVIRPLKPWSKNVHQLMEYFRDIGIPVPKIIKIDEYHTYEEYIDGEISYAWTDDGLCEIGLLMKKMHEVAKKFKIKEDKGWRENKLRELGKPGIFSHSDMHLENIMTKNGIPVSIIDWDNSGPIDPIIELAGLCYSAANLLDDDLGKLWKLPSTEKRGEQIKIILDAYELDNKKRKGFIDNIMKYVICTSASWAIAANITFDTIGLMHDTARLNRSLYWILRNKKKLERKIL